MLANSTQGFTGSVYSLVLIMLLLTGCEQRQEAVIDTQLGDVRVTKYLTVHESGRILNPLPALDQIRGAVIQGIGQALHEDLLYDPASGQPARLIPNPTARDSAIIARTLRCQRRTSVRAASPSADSSPM